jgi:hypothetical protein
MRDAYTMSSSTQGVYWYIVKVIGDRWLEYENFILKAVDAATANRAQDYCRILKNVGYDGSWPDPKTKDEIEAILAKDGYHGLNYALHTGHRFIQWENNFANPSPKDRYWVREYCETFNLKCNLPRLPEEDEFILFKHG